MNFINLLTPTLGIWELIIRASIVYLVVLLLLRISGKRQMGQMGATEFVAILLISNAVQNAMNGGDNSLGAGLILAGVIIFLSSMIALVIYRNSFFSSVFEGTPTLLIHKGKLIKKHLMNERMSEKELLVLLRKQGVHKIDEIDSAILEADCTLTINRKGDEPLKHIDPPKAL
jgi:uncharacterized membrane protein YcaP (DUF421 family)